MQIVKGDFSSLHTRIGLSWVAKQRSLLWTLDLCSGVCVLSHVEQPTYSTTQSHPDIPWLATAARGLSRLSATCASLRHAGSTGSAARPCCGVRVAVGHAAPSPAHSTPGRGLYEQAAPAAGRALRAGRAGGLFVVSTVICHFSHADPRFPWEGVRSDGDEVPLIFLKQRRSECQSSHFQGSPWVPCHWPWEAVACDAKAQRMFALQAQTELSLCEIS
jgi:hypothetical protein